MPISFDSAIGIHADTLRLRGQRAEVLATNLANVDTPNYKARDFNFQDALKTASISTEQPGQLKSTNSKHFATSGADRLPPALLYRQSFQDSLDGNSVDEQIEQSQFMQNSIQYQASLDFLGGKFKGLRAAIRGEL
jgi:flagellar basal-body rod protein FlgB